MKSNKDIRAYAIEKDVLIIQIAKEIGIQKSSISRKLAKELPQEEKDRICKAFTPPFGVLRLCVLRYCQLL